MGNSGSTSNKVPAETLLKLASESTANSPPVTDKPAPADDDIVEALSALGVDATGVATSEARQCWNIVAHQDFWRSHFTAHPKKKRVKTWLFVHRKFRTTMTSLVQAAIQLKASVAAAGFDRQAVSVAAQGIESSFRTLANKVDQHSEFEDTQLFRFFREHVPEIRDDIRDLEADHSEKQLEERVLSCLQAFREEAIQQQSASNASATLATGRAEQLATEAVASLENYAANLETHLEREERILVSRWLNLTPELYSKYRGYLVGKYRLAY